MRLKIGDKVTLSKTCLKNYLEHWFFDAHTIAGVLNKRNKAEYESSTCLFLVASMCPVVGTISNAQEHVWEPNTYWVEFKAGPFYDRSWYEATDLRRAK